MDLDLSGKKVIVTGGGKGIGAKIAEFIKSKLSKIIKED